MNATATRRNPITFSLHNADDEPRFIVTDDGRAQTMYLSITNQSGDDVTFTPQTKLRLVFSSDAVQLKQPLTRDTWTVTPDKISVSTTSAVVLGAGKTLYLKITGLKAASGLTARGARVMLKFDGLSLQAGTLASGVCEQALALVYHRGQKDIPMSADIFGSRVVVNTVALGGANSIRVRISNTGIAGGADINLAGGRLIFEFKVDTTPDASMASALGKADQVQTIQWDTNADKVLRVHGSLPGPDPNDPSAMFVMSFSSDSPTFLKPGACFDVTFSNFKCGHPSGETPLIVRYENITGFWDGQFELTLVKSPLLFMVAQDKLPGGAFNGLDLRADLRVRDVLSVNGGANNDGVLRLEVGTKILAQYPSFAEANRTFVAFDQNYKGDTLRGRAHLFAPSNYYQNVPALTLAGNYGVGGSVGVNNQAPEQTLDVGGTARVSGMLEAAGGLRVNTGSKLWFGTDGENTDPIYFVRENPSDNVSVLKLMLGDDAYVAGEAFTIQTTTGVELQSFKATGDVSLMGKHAFRGNDDWLRLNEDGAFSAGVHANCLFTSTSLNVGAWGGTWGSPGDGSAGIRGDVRLGGRLQIGNTSIGERELQILVNLTAGNLEFDLYNMGQSEYAYAADYAPFDDDRRRIFTWRHKNERVSQGRWRLHYVS